MFMLTIFGLFMVPVEAAADQVCCDAEITGYYERVDVGSECDNDDSDENAVMLCRCEELTRSATVGMVARGKDYERRRFVSGDGACWMKKGCGQYDRQPQQRRKKRSKGAADTLYEAPKNSRRAALREVVNQGDDLLQLCRCDEAGKNIADVDAQRRRRGRRREQQQQESV